MFLHDGELATLSRSGAEITTLAGHAVTRAPKTIDWSPTQAEKGGYKTMPKEIHEQPRAVEDTLRGRVDLVEGDVIGEEMGISAALAKSIRRVVYFVACGTSAHAAMAGRYWVEQIARVPAVVEIGSEVRYREPVFGPDDLVVAVSQSGETLDTLAAVKTAKAQGAHILAVANVIDSAIPRISDAALYTHAGPEIGVASTKCFTTQLVTMLLLAVYLGRRRGTLAQDEARRILDALAKVPQQMRDVLAKADELKYLAKKYMRSEHMLFLGRGTGFPIALEGALKLKEISYIHAEGYAAGEMKHGPIALIDEEMPVVVVCPKDAHYEKTFSNMQEVQARAGQIIAVCTRRGTKTCARCLVPKPLRAPRGGRARLRRSRTSSRSRPPRPRCCRCSKYCRCSFLPTTWPTSRGPTSTSRETWRRPSPWSESAFELRSAAMASVILGEWTHRRGDAGGARAVPAEIDRPRPSVAWSWRPEHRGHVDQVRVVGANVLVIHDDAARFCRARLGARRHLRHRCADASRSGASRVARSCAGGRHGGRVRHAPGGRHAPRRTPLLVRALARGPRAQTPSRGGAGHPPRRRAGGVGVPRRRASGSNLKRGPKEISAGRAQAYAYAGRRWSSDHL